MSIAKYRLFQKIIELGSLTKAGELMGYTQSGVSHSIKSLEDEVGFQLFSRNKGGVILTENGKIILENINAIIREDDDLKKNIAKINGLEIGKVRIGIFTSVAVEWLPKIIKKFQERYPGIEIQLIDGDYSEIEQWLLEDKLDIGFLGHREHLKVNYTKLLKDPMMAVIPIDHELAEEDKFPIDRFATEDFIFPHKGCDNDVKEVMDAAGITPNIKFDVRGDEAIIAMVKSGLGIAMLPNLYLKSHSNGVCVKPLENDYIRTICVGFSHSKTNNIVTNHFFRCLKEWLAENYNEVLFKH